MKFYNSMGPNPQIVRTFMAEKNIEMENVEVDLMAGENRQEAHMKRNPSGQMPALELDNGTYLSEVTAICEYLEEMQPEPALFGSTPEERAETRMWARKVDLNICEPMGNGFRAAEGYDLFKDRFPVYQETADGLKSTGQNNLAWLEAQMEGKDFICGDRFTYADIHLFGWLGFLGAVGQPLSLDFKNLTAWMERVGSRASATA
jgi:glutathione S-transferase